MARVLLVDTNFSSGPIRRALLELGHQVFLAGGKPSDFLAKNTPDFVQVDYSNPVGLAETARGLDIDLLVPGCNDLSYLSCVQANAILGLNNPGLDGLDVSLALNRKNKFRELGEKIGLNTPRTFETDDIPECPVIVKPVDAFSGKGIQLIEKPDKESLQLARKAAEAVSANGQCVVEQWIHGQLYSHSAFYKDGQLQADFFVVEHGSANPWVVDTSCVVELTSQIEESARQQAQKLVNHLQLAEGLLHTQFIEFDGRAWPVEVTRRCPGDLYSQLIKLSTGFDYAKAYACGFTGDKFHFDISAGAHRWVMRHTLTVPEPCQIGALAMSRPLNILKWVPVAETGDWLQQSPASRIALLFAACESESGLQELMQTTIKRKLYEVEAGI